MTATSMSEPSQVDRLRAYAQEKRVFSRSEIIADLGRSAAGALGQMAGGNIIRHAVGVYSIAGILPDDDRVKEKIAETGAKPLSDNDRLRDAKRAEDRAATAIASKIRTEDTLVDRVAAHFEANPVASAANLRKEFGKSGASAARTLEARKTIDKVNDGLWVRKGVDPFGPEMAEYVEANSLELSAVKRELSEVEEISRLLREGRTQIEWNISQPKGRGTAVYMNMVGVPSIWAKSHKGELRWYAVKQLVSPIAAEHIARMVLVDMPDSIHRLIHLVKSGNAPTSMRRRHGGYREFEREEESSHTTKDDTGGDDEIKENREERPYTVGYTKFDTKILDPKKLGNGLPEPIILEIDDREDDRLVTMLTGVENLHIIRTHLEMADFVARKKDAADATKSLAIERKTSSDLSSSLDDNRLVEQVHRMSASGITSCFIIEGGMMGVRTQPIARLASMQTRLAFGMNMPVLETIDMAHTCYTIVTAIRDHFFGTGEAFDLKPKKIPGLGKVERARYMLETIPGISPTKSAALLERFGSVAGVAGATPKEIMDIDGIGKKTAETLNSVLHAGQRG